MASPDGSLDSLRAQGVLTALDLHFAKTLGRLGCEDRDEVLLAAALLSRQVGRGNVCIDLPGFAADPTIVDREGGESTVVTVPEVSSWLDSLRGSRLVGSESAPLVLDAAGRLYLRRYFEYQERLASAILSRVSAAPDPIDVRALDRLFPGSAEGETDWQREAAAAALRGRFCVISGGPGTGKTYTVTKILALLLERARENGDEIRVALLAPTGKAAARLRESVENARSRIECDDDIRARIPLEASTIHKALGVRNGTASGFYHDASNPLPFDAVIVDEASMVDLALMTRLTDAMRPSARLILLGDRDQLASVEAGAVLGDICRVPSRASSSPLGGCIVQLRRTYRYEGIPEIGNLARAINEGDVSQALSVFGTGAVRLIEPSGDGRVDARLIAQMRKQFVGSKDSDPAASLHELGRLRILCAHRRGAFGVEGVNRQIEEAIGERSRGRIQSESFYPGRPILVMQNDYEADLHNGDVGIVAHDDRGGVQVCFPSTKGGVRKFAPGRIPAHETVFAMSVHKSQGSEFDEVAVLLPTRESPLLSRELLYTAVTRARHRVTVYGSSDVVRAAITRRIERTSGLHDILWRQS